MLQKTVGLLIIGVVIGIVSNTTFHATLDYTNTTEFCISCHEMKSTVYAEYLESSHFSNHSGVRAECHDCHVPQKFGQKLLRKAYAANDVYHWLLGSIDTQEKFEAKRSILASRVWTYMKHSDSRECRNCHSWESMAVENQERSASKKHKRAQKNGETCIDCHQGIAHTLPDIEYPFTSIPKTLSIRE